MYRVQVPPMLALAILGTHPQGRGEGAGTGPSARFPDWRKEMAIESKQAGRPVAPTGGAFLTERQDAAEVLIPEAFDDELRMFAGTAKAFVEREILPDFEALEALDYELSRRKMAKAGELGLLGVEIPEEYGGLGAGKAASAVITEAIAGSGSFNVTFSAHSGIGTLPIVYFGTEAQKA